MEAGLCAMANYNTAEIRKYLISAYGDQDITVFCFDYFRDVYDNLAAGMDKGQKIQLLLDYCQRRDLFFDLFAGLRKDRPGQFRQQLQTIESGRYDKAEFETNIEMIRGQVIIIDFDFEPHQVSRGQTLHLTYRILSKIHRLCTVWLGASIVSRSGEEHFNINQDVVITLYPSEGLYGRQLSIPYDLPLGDYRIFGAVWFGSKSLPGQAEQLMHSVGAPFVVVR